MFCGVSELSNGIVLFNDNATSVTESKVSCSCYKIHENNNASEVFPFYSRQIATLLPFTLVVQVEHMVMCVCLSSDSNFTMKNDI